MANTAGHLSTPTMAGRASGAGTRRVAILIPTKNRPRFIARQLAYYASLRSPHPVYVGDSSDPEHLDATRAVVARFGDRLAVVHLTLPGATDYEAIAELARHANEPYVAFAGDDDFLVPNALDRCAEFLGAHPEYASAHGQAVIAAVESQVERCRVLGTGPYAQRAVEHETARDRLSAYLSNYWGVCFSVQRLDAFRMGANFAAALSDKTFRELVASCLTIIRGKAKNLDVLYLIRQVHSARYLLPDPYDWVVGSAWQASCERFRHCLVQEIASQDGVDESTACAAVKTIFWAYLGRILQFEHAQPRRGPGLRARLRRRVRMFPGARRTWRTLQVLRAASGEEFSLPALLQPACPYHRDFTPVYRAIEDVDPLAQAPPVR